MTIHRYGKKNHTSIICFQLPVSHDGYIAKTQGMYHFTEAPVKLLLLIHCQIIDFVNDHVCGYL